MSPDATLTPTPAYDVILEGTYFCDLIFTGLPAMPQLGQDLFSAQFEMVPGGMFYTATAMHRLGLRTGWSCDFGDDFFSRFMLDAIRREGLDEGVFRFHDCPVRRLAAAFSFPHDRAFVSYADPVAPAPSLADLIRQHRPRSVCIGSLRTGPGIRDTVAAARDAGTLVYMDCQFHQTSLENHDVVEALQSVDVFAPNGSEALRLTGAASVEEAAARLADLVRVVAIKCGSEGAVAQSGDLFCRAPAIPVQAVDTTGAGDCFNAGFLDRYLRGEPLELCLRMGNICGGLSTTGPGSTAVPRREEAQVWLDWYTSRAAGIVPENE